MIKTKSESKEVMSKVKALVAKYGRGAIYGCLLKIAGENRKKIELKLKKK